MLSASGRPPETVAYFCHGTTLATNAVLEGRTAPTGLIVTAGFGDILDLARQRRPSFFNLDAVKPTPPTPEHLRFEVAERLDPEGGVVTPLDEPAVEAAALALKDRGAEAVAICFLHSYANPAHEQRAAEIVRRVWGEGFVTASADIMPEFREFERFATAAVNASLTPILDRYLERLEQALAADGVSAPLRVMQSNGGAATAAAVRRAPVNTFFSGPAGGVIGAAAAGEADGVADLITLDMGGTSSDVALIKAGVPGRASVREMGGFPVRARTLDLHTIGAGGGSLAWVDPGGLLKVGPASAGAMPGPACYGRGGERPTVTDANMALGRLNPRALAGGALKVAPDRAMAAIEAHLSGPLGLDVTQAAAGVLDVVNANMTGAVRVISVERGVDPRGLALTPFGGAGPLHACDVARSMGMARVFVPLRPGVLSAMGLLHADARGDFSQTVLAPVAEGADRLRAACVDLETRASAWADGEGLASGALRREWLAELRYLGQTHDLPVPFSPNSAAMLTEAFHAAHAATYGHAMPDRPVEIVTVRLAVTAPRQAAPGAAFTPVAGAAEIDRRPVWFRETGFVDTPILDRDRLAPGADFVGPAIVEQMDATTVVPPDARVTVARSGALLIDLEAAS